MAQNLGINAILQSDEILRQLAFQCLHNTELFINAENLLRDRRKVEKFSLVSVVFSDLAEMGRWIGLDWGGGGDGSLDSQMFTNYLADKSMIN